MVIRDDRTSRSSFTRRALAQALLLTCVALTAASCSPTVVELPPAGSASTVAGESPSTSIHSPGTAPNGDPSASVGPSPRAGALRGTSKASITGDDGLSMDLDFPTMEPYSFYTGLGSQSNLTFLGGSNALAVGGILQRGAQKTSDTIGLALEVPGPDPIHLASGDGSCRIVVKQATADRISGSFSCKQVPLSKNQSVDIHGTFSGAVS